MLNPFDHSTQALLEGIQGNILKAHGRHHTANVFIQGHKGKQAEAKNWLHRLVDPEHGIIESGYAQLRSNVVFKESGGKADTGLFACVHISAAGYDYLFGDEASQRFSDSSFRYGMKNADLNDPDPDEWELGLQADNHFMLLLAHTTPEALAEAVVAVLLEVESFARITAVEHGTALLNKEGAGIEHFGYVDGVSQPLFFVDEWDDYKVNNNINDESDVLFDPRARKELVLIKDPFAPRLENSMPDANAWGSYFVFRKLEQNVKGFKLAEKELANKLGLTGEAEERAGALLIGRFEDGTPVELRDEEGMIHSAVWNNFDYDPDTASRCPFHAHIRKSNPRSGLREGGMQEARTHIMARRGIPYGTRTDDPNDGPIFNKPEGGVGLLFMSYQASIVNQFEFIQKNWVNNSDFPAYKDGTDPLIGQGSRAVKGSYATVWGDDRTVERATFAQFVHLKGGEYFFAPSVSFLKNIQTIKISQSHENHLIANAALHLS